MRSVFRRSVRGWMGVKVQTKGRRSLRAQRRIHAPGGCHAGRTGEECKSSVDRKRRVIPFLVGAAVNILTVSLNLSLA